MMQLKEFLTPAQVLVDVNVTSKKRALEVIAKTVAATCASVDEQQVFDQLIDRERLGTTGFGNGVAIPHCRMESCEEPIVAIMKLATGIDFDAVDDQPVDILIGLVVPAEATDEHLQLLKQIAELLSNSELCKQIRATTDNQQLYQIIVNGVGNT
ncbi:PTS IIA-like nitrogen regulatory protein PtsN [Entomomonas asaccharolytica]|uniref:PTS IIA-like nitrogen regulatory protein PtsN n=1 Tax=Entomomonas asaccharolytica TaxID=2785331 RepID=A0A974NEV9_9GAMM|nr:PTS IIA-like nitrogen regulatory protein PtsN [Entomomonas asaccharolytica]QQP85253.1 PTS IIA-like nitrogen regulatory protein PtsN [Entomomonas asaccharolytica]